MTPDEKIDWLRKRVEFWQRVLTKLGIGHFQIDRISLVDEPFGSPDADASVIPAYRYDRCKIEFSHAVMDEMDEWDRDHTIVHELLHVAMRDYDSAIESIEEQLAPAVQEVWHDRVKHEREGIVDRLAWLIVYLKRDRI